MSFEEERKFLHDLANPLAVTQGNLRIALRKLDGLKLEPQIAEALERLNKAVDACEKMVQQVSERRQNLSEKQEAVS